MKRKLFLLVAAFPAVLGIVSWWMPGRGILSVLLSSYAFLFVTLGLGVLAALGLRRVLWRVGHRLAFSYFLIGVVPIPLAGLLILVVAYISNGFLLGHLYRDAVHSVASELRFAAQAQFDQFIRLGQTRQVSSPIPVVFAFYRDGRRLGGDTRAPRHFQKWWVKETIETAAPSPISAPFVALEDGRPTLMAAVAEGRFALLALYAGDLELELSERSGVWVELLRADEAGGGRALSFNFQDREYALRLPRLDWQDRELAEFFYQGDGLPGLMDRPMFGWAEISRPFLDLAEGSHAAEYVYATLTGSPRTIHFHLISRSAEVDTFAYLVMLALIVALIDLWILAAMMALLMISGLSKAVNRLSRATRLVQQGDFSARVEVRRKDQLGELQRSFNLMTENLEKLVASAAREELLERDLEIARELQQSLLPGELATGETACFGEALRFATHFAPSAAIGGDYYDVLPVADGRVAVVVADVSGHGVAAGLRMAMVKSALQLLSEEESDPAKILSRIHSLQSSSRGFVTATMALVDCETGQVEITNAGHPPTYLWRAGEVTEIALPSTPLGALEGNFEARKLELEPEDVLVWLSDGLIEAEGGAEEPFGYGRIVESLEQFEGNGAASPALGLRDHLLAALSAHTGDTAPEDDRTLLVMVYRPPD